MEDATSDEYRATQEKVDLDELRAHAVNTVVPGAAMSSVFQAQFVRKLFLAGFELCQNVRELHAAIVAPGNRK